MAIFDGLQLYELVLLALGTILFLVLIFGFLYNLIKGKSITALLGFFVFPIAMIGFPAIQKIQIDGTVVSIEKATDQLLANPTDADVRKTLQEEVEKVTAKPISNPRTLTVLAKAQYALGNEKRAENTLQKALDTNPKTPGAIDLKNKITVVKEVEKLASKVEANPNDTAAKTKLQQSLSTINEMQIANPKAITEISRAQAAVGQDEKALQNAKIAAKIEPTSPSVQQLNKTLERRIQLKRPN